MVKAAATWTPQSNCPQNVADLRAAMKAKVRTKAGKQLIADKFTKDHVFAGHAGNVQRIAGMLARLRELPMSTLLVSSIDSKTKAEVLNWIDNVPAAGLTLAGGTWTISNRNTGVTALNPYKFATVDLAEFRSMNRDDIVPKSRRWLTESNLTPKIACYFAADGTPVIYHMDY